MKILLNNFILPINHWSLNKFNLEDVISLSEYKSNTYAIYPNPTDQRCMRLIIRYINNENMKSTFNRYYTNEEETGLFLTTLFFKNLFQTMDLIPQILQCGNNSQYVDENGNICIGKKDEPSFLHNHLILRGIINKEYIPGIKLLGPIIGTNFDMMGKTKHQIGNEKKIPWKSDELKLFLSFMKNFAKEFSEKNSSWINKKKLKFLF